MRPQHWIYTVPLRLRSLFRRRRVEQELNAELEYHMEARVDELVRDGMPADRARQLASREMGGVEQHKEECRDARRTRPLEDLVRDVVFALRMLRKNPGFTAVVIAALAFGIGANTALFSLFNQVLIRKLPVANPDELVVLATESPRWGQMSSFSNPMFRELRERNAVFTGMLAQAGIELNVGDGERSDKVNGQLVSGEYFEQLGVQPWLGRLLNRNDDRTPGGHPVAVLSHGFWQRRFGGDPAIVGRVIMLNGNPITVIGVSPPEFYGTDLSMNIDIRVPLMMTTMFRPQPPDRMENAGYQWMRVMGRLKPGVSRAQAEAALDVLHRQIREHEVGRMGSTMSETGKAHMLALRLKVLPGEQGFRQLQQGFAKALRLLLAITVVILVITCANLANMLLARNATRQQEVTMRLALGASRGRLARQWLTESALLSLLGGGAGIFVAVWCQSALLSFMPEDQRGNLTASPDMFVLGFALLVSLATGVIFGLIPALKVSRSSLEQAQQATARVSTGFRGALVALQIALCVPLLIIAGLFLNSLRNTRLVPAGFEANQILVASLNPTLNGYADARLQQFYARLLEEVRFLPDVEAAGVASSVVLSGNSDKIAVVVEGYQPTEGEDRSPYLTTVSPGYFSAMRLPLLAGRDFTDADSAESPHVGVINETMARYYFGDANPIGRKFGTDSKSAPNIEIIGVVKDAKYVSLKEKPKRHYYLPLAQTDGSQEMALHVRTRGSPERFVETLRARMRAIDPHVPLFDVKTLAAEVDESLTQDRLITWLSTALGILATLLATIGLYGVIAFSVARRTREVGIRMALGAQRGDIFGLIVKRVSILVVVGLAAGVALAVAGGKLVGSILFGVQPTDPATFISGSAIIIVSAALAAYLPARRALRVNPSIALRYE